MKRLTEAQKTAVKAAVDANDPEKLQAVLAECGCMAAAPAKEAKGGKGKAKAAPPPASADVGEADDADEADDTADDVALDEAVEAAKRQADEAADTADEVEEADDADEADGDDDDGDDDGDEADGDEVEEAMGHLPGGAGKFIKGTTPSGPGKATTPGKQPGGRKKRRSREAAAEVPLTAREQKLLEQNARLSAQLRIRTTADRARNLLRESAIPEKMRPEILPLMIGKSEDEMRKVVRYHERFIQTAIAEAGGYSTEVEGAGSRFRESAGDAGAVDSALAGLPLKG